MQYDDGYRPSPRQLAAALAVLAAAGAVLYAARVLSHRREPAAARLPGAGRPLHALPAGAGKD